MEYPYLEFVDITEYLYMAMKNGISLSRVLDKDIPFLIAI
jgi:hypothetical protein